LKLLVAASGTGGHLFPAIAIAQELQQAYALTQIEWLGVPDRLETRLVPKDYSLHTINIQGFQQGFGLNSFKILWQLIRGTWQTRQLLRRGKFQGVLTTGGYIAAPAIIAARSLGLPAILHESNSLPGKVTRWLSPWCSVVAVGFASAAKYLPKGNPQWVGTPVRADFFESSALDLPVPPDVPLIVVFGGSQGAVAVNDLVRQSASVWLDAGAWIVHLTGDTDQQGNTLSHPHYLPLPFYDNMAALLQRANLAISRSGAGSLTELAATGTPSILIPYPFAAEDHQTYNAKEFAAAGAAKLLPQNQLTAPQLAQEVLDLLRSPQTLATMSQNAKNLAIPDSTQKLAALITQVVGV
jgi:UDP-N-acetylglucosamine--N-acetylmuramyl-(pentapeptide) pyrophosphoryl-undecaprenol N-acetylglucosamine transferase